MTVDRPITRDPSARSLSGEREAFEQTGDKRPEERKVEYLTARQLGEVLQISESTVHRLRRSGRIPAVLLTDRLIRFNLRDVQKALKPSHAPRPQPNADGPQPQEKDPDPQLSFESLFAQSQD
ncbi:MAG TPA: helix-turn-helix domain-containing protein [Blastocatellia bacterium]|nr:helix-turn-helix domain-containing protein [Blastocatellia bacterium]